MGVVRLLGVTVKTSFSRALGRCVTPGVGDTPTPDGDSNRLHVGNVISEAQTDTASACSCFLGYLSVVSRASGIHSAVIRSGTTVTVDVHASSVPCRIMSIAWRQAPAALESNPAALAYRDIAEVWLEPLEAVCIEVYSACPPLGRFAMRDGSATLAVGVVTRMQLAKDRTACFED